MPVASARLPTTADMQDNPSASNPTPSYQPTSPLNMTAAVLTKPSSGVSDSFDSKHRPEKPDNDGPSIVFDQLEARAILGVAAKQTCNTPVADHERVLRSTHLEEQPLRQWHTVQQFTV